MRAVVGILIVLVVLSVGAVGIFLLWPSEGGIQLTYSIQFPPGFAGDRQAVTRETAEILQKRAAADSRVSGATPASDGRVILRLAAVTQDELYDLRSYLEPMGRFGIYEVKSEDHPVTDAVPEGFRVFPPSVLVRQDPILRPGEVLRASFDRGDMSIVVHPDAAKRFEGATRAIFQRDPPGVLAVAFDDRLVSLPAGDGPARDGRWRFGVVLGALEASSWAIVLEAGPLPHPIGAPKVETYRGRSLKP